MTGVPLIIGAGPTGIAAALFLARRGIECRIVDRREEPSTESKALAANPRTFEILETAGLAEKLEAESRPLHRGYFYDGWNKLAELSIEDVHPRYKMSVIPQARTEALLAEALAGQGIRPERGVQLDKLTQAGGEVRVTLVHADGREEEVAAPLLLGADGAHSRVRDCLGISFDGDSFPEPWPLYDVELDDPLSIDGPHISLVKGGLLFLLALKPGLWRIIADVPDPLGRLPEGAKVGSVVWHSSFHVSHRLAKRAVSGRVALAGDAAHIHSPVGARGMNLGIEDAYVFAACAADALGGRWERLEEYHRLRHPVQKSVVDHIRTLTTFARGQPDIVGGLRKLVLPGLAKFGPTAHFMTRMLTGLDHDLVVEEN